MAQITLNSTGVASDGALALQSNGTTTAVTIDTSQKVGIGTASPATTLHLRSAVCNVRLEDADTSAYANVGVDNSGSMYLQADPANSQASSTMYFSVDGTERMRIDSSGNVGIGTTPSAWNSSVKAVQLPYGCAIANLGAGDVVVTQNAYFDNPNFKYASTTGVGSSAYRQIDGTHRWSYAASGTADNNITFSEAMRIDTAGRLLVGTTSLVSGFSAISTIVSATNTSSNITLKDTGTTYGTGTQYISFVNSSNAGAGSIQHTAVTTVAYATTSDLRLKENITDCPSALNIAQQIKVRSYNWKEDGRHVDYGFVAQELNHFFPDAVCQGDDSEEILDPKQTWQVDYGKITPLLLKAIQEQQAIITSLTDRITALEAK